MVVNKVAEPLRSVSGSRENYLCSLYGKREKAGSMIKESTILLNAYLFFDLIQVTFEDGTLVVF